MIKIDQPDCPIRTFPGTYREVAPLGLLWLKIHVYWFGYRVAPGEETTVINVIWHRADIPARVVR